MQILEIIKRILQLLGWTAKKIDQRQQEARLDEKRDKEQQIKTDVDAAMLARGWVLHESSTHRPDGTPVDYDVSGPSGTLRSEDK